MEYRRIRLVRVGNSPIINFAAKELKKYLKMADNTIVVDEVIRKEFRGDEETLTLKVCPKLPERLGIQDPAMDDGYEIKVENDHGVIKGTNERSVLLGVYRYLRELGYAFTRPGTGGERVPEQLKKEYQIYVFEKAAYRHRGVTIEGADTYQNILNMIDFLPKAGMNEYFIQFWVPGTFFERWYFHDNNPLLAKESITREDVEGFVASLEEEIQKRGIIYHKTGHGWTCEPFGVEGTTWDNTRVYDLSEETKKYFAEVNGKRELWGNVPLNTNLCYSNPEVRSKIANAISDYSKKNPQIDVIHFWLADGSNNHCECENCRKKRPSDWYVQMLNEVDAKLTESGNTKTKIVFLIYVDLLWEPMEEKLKNPDRFILMFAPITRYYGVNYSDSEPYTGELPEYRRNHLDMPKNLSQNLARLSRWQDQFKGDSFIFDYHLQWAYCADPGMRNAAENIYKDMAYLKNMGLDGNVSCQVQRCFFPTGIGIRALSDSLWNPEVSFEDMEKSYYTECYGEDGDAIREYLKQLSDLFTVYRYYHRLKPVSKEEESADTRPYGLNYVKSAAEVKELVDGMVPFFEKKIAEGGQREYDYRQLKIHADYVKLLADTMEAADQENEELLKEKIETVAHYLNQVELDVQEVMDGDNMVRMLRGHFQGSF